MTTAAHGRHVARAGRDAGQSGHGAGEQHRPGSACPPGTSSMASQVHMAMQPAMSVLTNAWAAMPLARQGRAGVEPEPPEPQQAGAQGHERHVCGTICSSGVTCLRPDHTDRGQRGEPRAGVHHDAAGEVQHAPLRQEAAAPDPVHERDVDQQAPHDQEVQVALEADPVGERAGDQRRGDDGEHLLEHEVRRRRDGRRPRGAGASPTWRSPNQSRLPMMPADSPPQKASE